MANLARLDLSDEEIEKLTADLCTILEYVDKLANLDTQGVEPTFHAVAVETHYRSDEVSNQPQREDAVANAPRREKHFFVVPSIIE